jgi:hypothetical protein
MHSVVNSGLRGHGAERPRGQAERTCTASSTRGSEDTGLKGREDMHRVVNSWQRGYAQRRQLGPVGDRDRIKGQEQNDTPRAGRPISPMHPRGLTTPMGRIQSFKSPNRQDPGDFP